MFHSKTFINFGGFTNLADCVKVSVGLAPCASLHCCTAWIDNPDADWFSTVSYRRALQLRREAQMVSPEMGAAMIGTLYFLRADCAQHGGSASGGGLISASLLKLQGSI